MQAVFYFLKGGIILPRLARKDLNTPFLHVMVQGINKEYIFNEEKYIKKYLEIINKVKENYDFTIMAYCIMNNHAHFLVYVEDIQSFGKFMQKVNLMYSKAYNKSQDRVGVLFRNRYQIEPIYDEKYLINCIKYIHENPVKANMVSKCEDYKYSSYNDYISNSGVAKSDIVKKCFGEDLSYFQEDCHIYKRKFIDVEEESLEEIKEHILDGITEYQSKTKINISDIFLDRKIFKTLILFLKKEKKITYNEIANFFDISINALQYLRK